MISSSTSFFVLESSEINEQFAFAVSDDLDFMFSVICVVRLDGDHCLCGICFSLIVLACRLLVLIWIFGSAMLVILQEWFVVNMKLAKRFKGLDLIIWSNLSGACIR